MGPRLRTYEPANRPQGVMCALQFRTDTAWTITGELLALDDSAAVLVVNNRIVMAPYRRVRGSNCRQAGPIPFRGDTYRLHRDMAALHIRLARYPQGVSPSLMTALLAAYGQAEPDWAVRP